MGDQTTRPSADVEYMTLWEMALALQVQAGTLSRWVKQWMPSINEEVIKSANRRGLALPAPYVLVGRGWKLSTDKRIREVMLRILPSDPKSWLVVVGDRGIACYDGIQAAQEVARVLGSDEVGIPGVLSVFHLGEPPTNTVKERSDG